jgi:hypothetical protein
MHTEILTEKQRELLDWIIEAVDYIIPNPPTDDEIKQKLIEIAIAGV